MPQGLKRLSYRAVGNPSQQGAAEHWDGFTFIGGRWQVIYKGSWGQIQVWAVSEAEGRRVIRHACSHALIDPDDPNGEWFAAEVSGSRYRVGVLYRVKVKFGAPVVTVRSGPDGPPTFDE